MMIDRRNAPATGAPLLLLLWLPLLSGCGGSLHTAPDGAIEHVVLCWLKAPGSEEGRDRLIAAAEELRAIPGVLSVTAGRPEPSDRAVVDDSFDVGFVILLENRAALRSYLTHPLHVAAVRNVLAPLVERTVIYDVVVE